jgi:hypothetical protein
MTKRREPLTYQDTLTTVAALLGWDRCGAICGVSGRAARYWSDHDCETEIRMIDAERLDRAYLEHGGEHAPFHRMLSLRLEIAAHATPDANLSRAASITAKEAGEAVCAMIEASQTDSPDLRRKARREAQEAIEALMDGIVALDGATCDGKAGEKA